MGHRNPAPEFGDQGRPRLDPFPAESYTCVQRVTVLYRWSCFSPRCPMTRSPERLNPTLLVFLIQLLILTGCGGGGASSTSSGSQILDASYGQFRKTNGAGRASGNATVNMSYPRTGHSATLLADGRVLIAGGNNTPVDNPNFTAYNTAELFDPSTELFSMVPSTMSVARTEQCAVTMSDKRVLIISGAGNYGSLPDLSLVDIFDPSTSSFSPQHVAGYQLLPSGTSALIHCIAFYCLVSAFSSLVAQSRAIKWRLPQCLTSRRGPLVR